MAPALRMTRSIKEKLPIFLHFVSSYYLLYEAPSFFEDGRFVLAIY